MEAEIKKGQESGNDYISARLAVEDTATFNIYHTIGLPQDGMDDDKLAAIFTGLTTQT